MAGFVGQTLKSVERGEHCWFFVLDRTTITATCPWRLLAEGRIEVSDTDDGQRFGLPAPVDAVQRVMEHLAGKAVSQASAIETTADLVLAFDNGARLEFWNNSSGYEAWTATSAASRATLVATGGGELRLSF